MTMTGQLLLPPLLVSALAASLTILALSLALRRWRRRPRPVEAVPELPVPASRAPGPAADPGAPSDAGGGRAFARALMGPDAGIWRPPARETFLQRQRQDERQRTSREIPARRLNEARRRAAGDLPLPRTPLAPSLLEGVSRPDSRAGMGLEPPPADPTRPTRLGRKRQGLDSLITELPRAPGGLTGEH